MRTTIELTPMQFRECLAHIGCMSERDFAECFEDFEFNPSEHHTCYQYMKFTVDYKRDVAKWVLYLDLRNLNLLMRYLDRHIGKGDVR